MSREFCEASAVPGNWATLLGGSGPHSTSKGETSLPPLCHLAGTETLDTPSHPRAAAPTGCGADRATKSILGGAQAPLCQHRDTWPIPHTRVQPDGRGTLMGTAHRGYGQSHPGPIVLCPGGAA